MTVNSLDVVSASSGHGFSACRMREDDRGQDLVEFALVLPFILVLTLAIIDLAHATMVYTSMAYAAREGARYGIVAPAPTVQQIKARILDTIPNVGVAPEDITVHRESHSIQVTISNRILTITGYFLRPFGGTPIMTLRASSHMRTE